MLVCIERNLKVESKVKQAHETQSRSDGNRSRASLVRLRPTSSQVSEDLSDPDFSSLEVDGCRLVTSATLVVTGATLVVTGALLVVTMFATSNKCHPRDVDCNDHVFPMA